MSKFVMECPNCGKFVEARTGFFAKKKLECSCGYIINVKTDKDAVRLVPDILQNGEEFFFPVFTSAEEMGEYGEHFFQNRKAFSGSGKPGKEQ